MNDATDVVKRSQRRIKESGRIMIALHVKPGMNIFGQDNVEIGTIKEVWAQTEAHGYLPVSRYLLQDYGPIKGTGQILSMEEGYLQVRSRNSGGSDPRDLWVPLHAVGQVDMGTTVTLKADAGTYESQFARRPEWLQRAA
jgi:hypothetical protein